MRSSIPGFLVVAMAGIALAACHRNPADTPAPPTASTAPMMPAPPGSARLPGDHAVTRRYRIAIELPVLPAADKPLADALRATADDAKREFLQALPDPGRVPAFADRQFELDLEFKVTARTPAFTCVRETGMQDTGGAHPIPVEAAFVFDREGHKLVTLDDLFVDPDAARRALAGVVRDRLRRKFMAEAPKPGEGSPAALREWKSNMLRMLDDGTQPDPANYSVFVMRAGADASAPSPGLTLIFPPYQVAPYVYGTQTVEVATPVFAKFLKPRYRGAFTH